jgi:hypothetical protein
VIEYTAPPNFSGPPPHWHKVMTEIFYVVEGAMTFRVGEQTLERVGGACRRARCIVSQSDGRPPFWDCAPAVEQYSSK